MISRSFTFITTAVSRSQEELFYSPRKKKNPQHPINFSSTIFCLWSASSFTTPLTTLIAAWMSGSVDYDLEIPFLMSAFGKLTSVSFPILLFIGCSLKVSASLRNERSFMSLGRRDFNIGRNSWEVLASLIYRFFFFVYSSILCSFLPSLSARTDEDSLHRK